MPRSHDDDHDPNQSDDDVDMGDPEEDSSGHEATDIDEDIDDSGMVDDDIGDISFNSDVTDVMWVGRLGESEYPSIGLS